MVLFSKASIHRWIGFSNGSRDGWCPIDSISSNSAKIILMDSGKYKISTKIGIIPDSGKDSTNIYSYGCSRKFVNNIAFFKDSISVFRNYKMEIMKRRFGFPLDLLIIGILFVGALPGFYFIKK
jgi:hypothetical protein